MKCTRIGIMVSLILLSISAKSQNTGNVDKKWNYSQFDFGMAIDDDEYQNMALDELLLFARTLDQLESELDLFEEEISTSTAGGAVYINQSFNPINRKTGKFLLDREIRIGIGFHGEREAMVSYKNKQLDTSLVFCSLNKAISIQSAYLKRGHWGKQQKWIWLYGIGLGSSISYSNAVMLIPGKYFEEGTHPSSQPSFEENMKSFNGRVVSTNRFYFPIGLNFKPNENWSIGLELRRGLGFQSIFGTGETLQLRKSGSFMISSQFYL